MTEPRATMAELFEGAKATGVGEWRDGKLWQVVTIESPVFKGGKVVLDFEVVMPPKDEADR